MAISEQSRRYGAIGAAALLMLGGCGGSDESTPAAGNLNSSTGAPSADPAAAEAVAKSKAILKSATAEPMKIKQGPPLTGKVEQGRTYVYMACELEQCQSAASGAKAAAEAIGWKPRIINFQSSDPATLVSGLKQALQFNPVAVSPASFGQDLWGSVIPDYEKAGVFLIPVAAGGKLALSKTVPVGISPASDYRADGETIGHWFIADSNAKGKALVASVDAFAVLKDSGDGIKDVIKQNCPACEVTSLNNTLAQLTSNAIVPAIVSALQKDPAIKYVLTSDGAFQNALPSALAAAGIKDIKIAGNAPNLANKQALITGTEHAWTGETIVQFGWIAVDAAARASLGMPLAEGNGGRVSQLLTKENVGTPTANLDKPADYKEQYKKLWGVS